MIMPPDFGPFRTREQAEAVFGSFRDAAHRAPEGVRFYSDCALTDTCHVLGGELGGYDRQVLAQLAELDPAAVMVVCSLLLRAAKNGLPRWS